MCVRGEEEERSARGATRERRPARSIPDKTLPASVGLPCDRYLKLSDPFVMLVSALTVRLPTFGRVVHCTAGLLPTLSYVFPDLLGTTKRGAFTGAGQPARRDLWHHRETDLQAIASRCFYHRLVRCLLRRPYFHSTWCAGGA